MLCSVILTEVEVSQGLLYYWLCKQCHYYTWGTFGEENTNAAAEVLTAQNTRLRWNPTWNAQNQFFGSLVGATVAWGLPYHSV